jgi:hypothetical protein
LSLPPRISHLTTTIIPPANARISAALKIVLIAFRVKDAYRLYILLPTKRSALYGLENMVYNERV